MHNFNLKNNDVRPAGIYFRSGFTLVEMMVAIAVFSIVMVTAMSALLNVIDANNKARSIKTAINNISFALDGISKDMRMGDDYKCIDDGYSETRCVGSGNIGIKFTSSKDENPTVYYVFKENGGIGQILSCTADSFDTSFCGNINNYSPLTSSEVDLEKVKFYVLNEANKQPRMIMTVSGKAGPNNKPKLQTDFDLQTSISQRNRS